MISCEIISYAFAWRRCGYTAHAFSFSHPSPPVAVAQYSVGWSVLHGAHTAVLGIRVDVFFGKRTLKTTWHLGIRTDLDGSTWWLNRRGEGGAAIVSSASFSV